MGKLYAGQTKLRIRLTVGQDITGATVLVKYRKPDGTEGSFADAHIEDNANGIIYCDVNADGSEIPTANFGEWMFWAHITFADGRFAPGEAIWEHFYEEPA